MSAIEQQRIRVLPSGLVSRTAAAAYLGVSPKTLAAWATKGRGPDRVKVGGQIYYRLSELEKLTGAGAA